MYFAIIHKERVDNIGDWAYVDFGLESVDSQQCLVGVSFSPMWSSDQQLIMT